MTKPQERRVKPANLGRVVETFVIKTSTDIQPGLVSPLVLPTGGVDASEIEKETPGQKNLDKLVATVAGFAQAVTLTVQADGITVGFEHIGTVAALPADACTILTAAITAAGFASVVVTAA